MKVLYDISILGLGHILPQARTGVFRVIENVAEQLIKQQDCDLIFCSDMNFYSVGNTLAYLKQKESLSATPFSKPPYYDLKVKKNSLIKLIHSDALLSPAKKFQIKWQIRQLILQEKVLGSKDLIHSKDLSKADIYHSPFTPIPDHIKGKNKIPFLTCYDLIPILYPQYVEEGVIDLIKNVLKSISYDTWVLCISASTRNDLLNYLGNKVDPDKVIVTELAASEIFYHSSDKERNRNVRSKYNISDTPYILSLCTLEPRKNIDQVIKAFKNLVIQEGISDLNLVLVGTKGWMFDKIFEEINANPALKNRVIITGYVADEDLASLYSDAAMFVYPSFYEGFGLPPLEAMQCGVPVITSNTSSLPEVVGDAAIMISPADLDALCDAMLSIYKNPSLRREMVVNSLERAGRFSWNRCARETVNAYKMSLSA